jgi:hypothetical protein
MCCSFTPCQAGRVSTFLISPAMRISCIQIIISYRYNQSNEFYNRLQTKNSKINNTKTTTSGSVSKSSSKFPSSLNHKLKIIILVPWYPMPSNCQRVKKRVSSIIFGAICLVYLDGNKHYKLTWYGTLITLQEFQKQNFLTWLCNT